MISDKDITQDDIDQFNKVIGLINEYSNSLLSLAYVKIFAYLCTQFCVHNKTSPIHDIKPDRREASLWTY